jgi:alpha-ribazole phosphatase/probable phosphoglycerate mutase
VTLELVYETHSTTTDNEAGIATGWLPGELSDLGRAQAAELGQRRGHDGIAAIYVSDLARALETARIAFGDTGLELIADARLRECNYGRLNGTLVATLQNDRAQHVIDPWPEGESYTDVVDRTGRLLDELMARWDGSRLLLIGHSANHWALDHLLLGADLRESVTRGMTWRPGWEYVIESGWRSGVAERPTYTRFSP